MVVKIRECTKFKGFLVEFLENRRSLEHQRPSQNRQKSGPFLSLAFYNAPSLDAVESSFFQRGPLPVSKEWQALGAKPSFSEPASSSPTECTAHAMMHCHCDCDFHPDGPIAIRDAETTILIKIAFWRGLERGKIYGKLSKNAFFPGKFH